MFFKLTLIVLAIVEFINGFPQILLKSEFERNAGKPIINKDTYIIDGEIVEGRQYPSVVYLKSEGNLVGGGSILSSEWILTAAHVAWYDVDTYSIVAGSNSMLEGGTNHSAVEIYLHPNFNVLTTIGDIGLVKVSPPIVLGNGVEAVKLPKKYQETPDGSHAVIVGWGITKKHAHGYSNELRKADIKILDQVKCNNTYENYIENTQICAGLEEGGKDACDGDEGGPLYVNNEVIGIMSWGKICGSKDHPTVYTKVSHYVDWIEKYISG